MQYLLQTSGLLQTLLKEEYLGIDVEDFISTLCIFHKYCQMFPPGTKKVPNPEKSLVLNEPMNDDLTLATIFHQLLQIM